MARSPADVRLIEAELPEFGVPETRPELAPEIYAGALCARLTDARRRQAGFSALVVYADREHFANIAWLTGFDPRFEEALLVIVAGPRPGASRRARRTRAPAGRRRSRSMSASIRPSACSARIARRTPPLADLLADAGIVAGAKVGVVGWKYYGPQETAEPELLDREPGLHRRHAPRPASDRPARSSTPRRS